MTVIAVCCWFQYWGWPGGRRTSFFPEADTQQLVPTLHIEHYEEKPGSEPTTLERGETNPMSQSQMAYSWSQRGREMFQPRSAENPLSIPRRQRNIMDEEGKEDFGGMVWWRNIHPSFHPSYLQERQILKASQGKTVIVIGIVDRAFSTSRGSFFSKQYDPAWRQGKPMTVGHQVLLWQLPHL